jgi:hypothetical protein
MPVARFLRLLLTLFVLLSGPLSALGSRMLAAHGDDTASKSRAELPFPASLPPRDEHSAVTPSRPATPPIRLTTADVGRSTTSPGSGTVRPTSRGRSGLLSLFSRALAAASDIEAANEDGFEGCDPPDLVDDDGPQGFVAGALSELSMPRLSGSYSESDLWGIQPSIGHPRGDDEPPRV